MECALLLEQIRERQDDKDHDDKSLIEKTLDAVKEIVTSARDAAKHAMEPEPVKPGDQVVLIPIAGDGFADSLMSPHDAGGDPEEEADGSGKTGIG